MANDKTGTVAVLTGSTGSASKDMTPRTAWVTMLCGGTTLGCIIGGADATVTGIAVTLASSVAVLSLAAFDGIIRPRL